MSLLIALLVHEPAVKDPFEFGILKLCSLRTSAIKTIMLERFQML